jgi:hypothetical protein
MWPRSPPSSTRHKDSTHAQGAACAIHSHAIANGETKLWRPVRNAITGPAPLTASFHSLRQAFVSTPGTCHSPPAPTRSFPSKKPAKPNNLAYAANSKARCFGLLLRTPIAINVSAEKYDTRTQRRLPVCGWCLSSLTRPRTKMSDLTCTSVFANGV